MNCLFLEMVSDWCRCNEMELATSKSWFMPLGNHKDIPNTLQDLPFPTVNSARLLGVILDQRLNFGFQIAECERFWNFRLRILRILVKIGMPFKKLLSVCYSFRGKLTFGLYWWLQLSKTNQNKLCSMWRIAIRIAAGLEPTTPTEDFFKALAIPPLDKFVSFLLTKRRFEEKFEPKEKDEITARSSSTRYNLRPRPQPADQPQVNLLTESTTLLHWLQKETKLKPTQSPMSLLKRKMFGNKMHPDTNILEIVKVANRKNKFYMSLQMDPE